ncbi:hypothetical protein MPTK1_8g12820 [Marchantia polymorpha subsp. ruderalis]|uniref:Uncharacterized protein n=1 Tax=Marchantia polymorpha TaxID=3197 RepID=A0A2R6WJR4_MARPO|nr:hypothetical protein MARPO_0083s0038 [Marchantia polymorpha]BBN19694.1 hypothetical protein Mp_8g12820 [Marchantia polymorpha subsp. ruderalis]|eukprot:PTQ34073.1 hypothetical protein MARPO_0083s0038 [Marchantia polymorpha]
MSPHCPPIRCTAVKPSQRSVGLTAPLAHCGIPCTLGPVSVAALYLMSEIQVNGGEIVPKFLRPVTHPPPTPNRPSSARLSVPTPEIGRAPSPSPPPSLFIFLFYSPAKRPQGPPGPYPPPPRPMAACDKASAWNGRSGLWPLTASGAPMAMERNGRRRRPSEPTGAGASE